VKILAKRKKLKRVGKKALSIPVIPTAFMAYVASKAISGASFSADGLGVPFENLKAEWKTIGAGLLMTAAATVVARKFNVGIGIPGVGRLRLG